MMGDSHGIMRDAGESSVVQVEVGGDGDLWQRGSGAGEAIALGEGIGYADHGVGCRNELVHMP